MTDKDQSQMSPIDAQLSPTPTVAPSTDNNYPSRGAVDSVTQSKLAVIGVLFLVTGALGLPLLWINRRFSRPERLFWTLVVLMYTLSLIWVTVEIVLWTYQVLFPG